MTARVMVRAKKRLESLVLPAPTLSSDDLVERRLQVLKDAADSEHPYLSNLAQQKYREFADHVDVSAYLSS